MQECASYHVLRVRSGFELEVSHVVNGYVPLLADDEPAFLGYVFVPSDPPKYPRRSSRVFGFMREDSGDRAVIGPHAFKRLLQLEREVQLESLELLQALDVDPTLEENLPPFEVGSTVEIKRGLAEWMLGWTGKVTAVFATAREVKVDLGAKAKMPIRLAMEDVSLV
jgi:hypothetical protein